VTSRCSSRGIAIEDIAAIHHIYKKALRNGMGKRIKISGVAKDCRCDLTPTHLHVPVTSGISITSPLTPSPLMWRGG